LTNKEHRNVLADCDKLNENYRKMGLAEISAGVYIHPDTGTHKFKTSHTHLPPLPLWGSDRRERFSLLI
jgi:hypothetical protein